MHWNHALGSADTEALMTWIRSLRKKHYATPGIPEALQGAVIQPLPKKVDQDPRKVALGEKLYHDGRLSKDNSISCASCHDLAKGGTDQAQFSTGVGGAIGDINAPTTFNSGYQFLQFWDGRAATLEDQADGPPNNPIEMASNWEEIIGKLSEDTAFTEAFAAVYPDGWSKETITGAIAAFERTLVTPNSPFDRFLLGDEEALTDAQKKGYALFQELACATCHVGPAMGGQSFEKMGLKADYFADRGNVIKPDYGRFNVTGDEKDQYKFKVPTLRNITRTLPYMHDGTQTVLKEVVKIMAKYQQGRILTDTEADSMAKFLESLTGEYKGKKV